MTIEYAIISMVFSSQNSRNRLAFPACVVLGEGEQVLCKRQHFNSTSVDYQNWSGAKTILESYLNIFNNWDQPVLRNNIHSFHDYLSFLNRYENEIIRFSFPQKTDMPFNEDTLNYLYKKYIMAPGAEEKENIPA